MIDTALYRRSRDTEAAPERILLIARRREDGRVALIRRHDLDLPLLLATDGPAIDESLDNVVRSVVIGRLGMVVEGHRLVETRLPVRMPHPLRGGEQPGFLRIVAVEVAGEPHSDATLRDVMLLPPDEARAALTTDLERRALDLGLRAHGASQTA